MTSREREPDDLLAEQDDESMTWEHLRRFAEAPLHRPLVVLVPWAALILLSIAALFVLPTKYTSSTLILIESDKMPDSFVPKVSTDSTDRRLENIKPEILSRTRLEKVLAETHPYPDTTSRTAALEAARRAIAINVSGADGFTIGFTHSDPRKAQEVTDRLTTLFIEETVRSRGQQVEEAVDFLVTQVNSARKELEEKDETLRRFKEQRMGRLPEQLQTNLATMGMLQAEARTVEESIQVARERQESLARSLGRSPSGVTHGSSPESEPAELRRQLAVLRSRYTDEHPDVQSLKARLARLEARTAEAANAGPEAADIDPSGTIAREQLARATNESRILEERKANLESRIALLRGRIDETPRTEQELSTLTRDYQKLNENYTALLSRQLEAQMAGRMERRWRGERFRVLDPANLPENPSSPNPPLVLGLGAIAGLLVGLGACLLAELLDATVKNAEELSGLGHHPVLARIPRLPASTGSSAQ